MTKLFSLKQVLILCTLVLLNHLVPAQCPTLVWNDEFDGTTLDPSRWEQMIGTGTSYGLQPGWGNNELQYYRPENTTVANGFLTITAKKENYHGSPYTSSRIRTLNKGDFTYGRFEARMKLPYSQGLWPAFWMLPTDNVYGGWPTSGEIDIMELVGRESHKVHGTIHYGDPWPNNQNQGNSYALHSGIFNDAFHEFAIEWDPGVIRWYVDGYLYGTKSSSDLSPFLWPFDQRFHFLLNLAVGGNWPGNPDATSVFPQSLVVDYVRVYSGKKPHITGNRTVANQATGQVYSVGNGGPGASYNWSVPAGASIVSGQGSSSITVNWGTTGGNVTAIVGTSCGNVTLATDVFVEPAYVKDFSFLNFDGPDNVTLNVTTGTYSPDIGNPNPNAVNSSALSARYIRNSSQQYDVLVYDETSLADGNEYVNGTRKFVVDIHTAAPVGTQILLQLENSNATSSNFPTGRHSRYVATTKAQNSWERLTFTLLDRPDGSAIGTSVSKIIFLFASNTFTGDTYYSITSTATRLKLRQTLRHLPLPQICRHRLLPPVQSPSRGTRPQTT
jgi:beta-glucanase (GH16 family)